MRAVTLSQPEEGQAAAAGSTQIPGFVSPSSHDCVFAVQDNWKWLSKLVECIQVHLKNASTYHQVCFIFHPGQRGQLANLRQANSNTGRKLLLKSLSSSPFTYTKCFVICVQFFHDVEETGQWLQADLQRLHDTFELAPLQGDKKDAERLCKELDVSLKASLLHKKEWCENAKAPGVLIAKRLITGYIREASDGKQTLPAYCYVLLSGNFAGFKTMGDQIKLHVGDCNQGGSSEPADEWRHRTDTDQGHSRLRNQHSEDNLKKIYRR